MRLKPLFKSKEGQPMRVGILMSGSGTNAEKIIEYQQENSNCNYQVVVIFTDNPNSQAQKIGKKNQIPVEILDIDKFFQEKNLPRYNLKARPEYDREVVRLLGPYHIDLLAYAGYMNITTEPIINELLGVNVHPADLSIKDGGGRRKYTGEEAVRDAIKAGEKRISSTTHIVTSGVDQGAILMISKPLKVVIPKGLSVKEGQDLDKIVELNQNNLKKAGDWLIFPQTLALIGQGKISQNLSGQLFFKEKPIPTGIQL
jgi:phosphoribosylglycinamide formyltransferase 1